MNHALVPASPSRRRTAVEWLGDLPGRVADLLARRPAVVPAQAMSQAALAAEVVRSPRANAYLSLEPELRVFRCDDGMLTWASHGRSAFAVGGLHVAEGGEAGTLVASWTTALREARYKRALLFPVSDAELPALRDGGMGSVMVGAEAFIDPDDWDLKGKRRADLRQMVNRGRKRYGVTTREVEPQGAADALGPLHRRWLEGRPASARMRLVVGSPALSFPLGRRYFAAYADDEPVAFVTVCPGWGGSGWGVDVMVRPRGAPAGAMDVLMVETIDRLFEEGAEVFSLGAAPMAVRNPPPPTDSRLLRWAFHWIYAGRLGNRLFRFESLARYKDKFAPRWERVHMGGWPKVSIAALYAGCRMWGLFGPPRLDAP